MREIRGEARKKTRKKEMDKPLIFMTSHGWFFETLCPVTQMTLLATAAADCQAAAKVLLKKKLKIAFSYGTQDKLHIYASGGCQAFSLNEP